MPIRVVEVEVERKAAGRRMVGDGPERRLEAGLVDDVGVQSKSQCAFADGGDEGGICAAQGRVRERLLASSISCRAESRFWIACHGAPRACLALALLGRQRVGQQPSAALRRAGDGLGAAGEQVGKEDRQAHPEEKPPA